MSVLTDVLINITPKVIGCSSILLHPKHFYFFHYILFNIPYWQLTAVKM